VIVAVLKKITKSAAFQSFFTWVLAGYLRFLHWSGRWDFVNANAIDQAKTLQGGAFIYAFWHGRLPLIWGGVRKREDVHVLISAHSDGRLIARVIELLGLKVVTGSSSRGGAKAMRDMLKLVKAGKEISITPDGPRGPRMRVQMGVIALAQMTGAPIVPSTFSAKSGMILKSWDRMQLPWPFSKGVYILGDPFVVPRDAEDLEPYRVRLEEILNTLTAEADRRMGQPEILPADPNERKRKRT